MQLGLLKQLFCGWSCLLNRVCCHCSTTREVSGLNVGLPSKIESTDPVSITSEAPLARSPPTRALAHRPCCHTPRAEGALAQMVIGCFLPHTRPVVCRKAGRHTGTPASLWVRRKLDMWVALQRLTCSAFCFCSGFPSWR